MPSRAKTNVGEISKGKDQGDSKGKSKKIPWGGSFAP